MNLQFIDAGQFKTLLTLQQNQPDYDDAGGYQEQWHAIATLWGQVEPQRAGNQTFAQQVVSNITHHITIRYRADITTSMRFMRAGRFFTISACHDPDESQRYLVCSVREEIR